MSDHDAHAAPLKLTNRLTVKFSRPAARMTFALGSSRPISSDTGETMRTLLTFVFLVFLPGITLAQTDSETADILEGEVIVEDTVENLEQFLWIKRPLVVFADNPADPRYVEQMQLITERLDDLKYLDVVVVTDTD